MSHNIQDIANGKVRWRPIDYHALPRDKLSGPDLDFTYDIYTHAPHSKEMLMSTQIFTNASESVQLNAVGITDGCVAPDCMHGDAGAQKVSRELFFPSALLQVTSIVLGLYLTWS